MTDEVDPSGHPRTPGAPPPGQSPAGQSATPPSAQSAQPAEHAAPVQGFPSSGYGQPLGQGGPPQGHAGPPAGATLGPPPGAPPGPPPGYAPPGYAPPGYAPPGYAPPGPDLDMLRARTRSIVARLDPSGLRPTLLVAGIIVALFFGAQLVNAVLPAPAAGPGAQPQPGGGTVDIGQLRVSVPAGWQVGEGPAGAGTRLARGSVAIDFQTSSFDGDAAALYRAFVAQALQPYASGFSATDPGLVQIGAGIPGARGAYAGVFGSGPNAGQVEGQLTTFVIDGTGVVVDAWGPIGTLRPLLPDVELIVATLEVR